MIFLIIFLIAIGIWESYVFYYNRYPEDLLLLVACFGAAMFLAAFLVNGVGV